MNNKVQIGTGQVFALLFTCRLLTFVIYSPFLDKGFFSGGWLFNTVLFCIFMLLFSVPTFIMFKYYPNDNPITLIRGGKALVKTISAFYCILFVFYSAFTFSRFDMFTTSVVFPEKDMTVLTVIAVFICAYAAYLGIEAISRANVILLSVILFGVAVILTSASKEFDVYNLEPILYYPVSSSVKSGFIAAANTVELPMLLFLVFKSKGNFKSAYTVSFISLAAAVSVLYLYLYGVSGEFANTQLFPFYSLAIIAEFPFFERLDSVITAMFIFSLLIKCSSLIYISSELVSEFIKNKKAALATVAVAASIMSVVLSDNMSIHRLVFSNNVVVAAFVIATVILPSTVLTVRRLKDGKI